MKRPYIDSETSLPEITIKAVILGALLSIVLSAANAYFGLFAGLTVSASIPAAVISMALLKVFKRTNILENNLVQTAASAGESLAAGIIFTIPALVIMGYWKDFNYWETTTIALCGGVLGVLFTIPLRKALITEENLKFPEGVATAEVLKTGEAGGKSVKHLIIGSLIGGIFKLCSASLNLWHNVFEKAVFIQQKYFVYFSLNLSPALAAVGYIVGLNIASLVFLGGVITWWVGIPLYISSIGYENIVSELMAAGKIPDADNLDVYQLGNILWSVKMRYLGVGAMVVGGLWALVSLASSLGAVFRAGVQAFGKGTAILKNQVRTERDTPISWVIIGIGVLIVPIFIIYFSMIGDTGITITMTIIMILAGFLFSAVAGYMAGLVGSSNNPISGVTIATILFASLLLLTLMGTENELQGAAGAILIGSVVCCAAAIAGDNMQDLKAGYILGATPYRQQIMQIVGVAAGAFVIPWVLNILLLGNGIGTPTPEHPDALAAPQATLMMSVAQGIFGDSLPWNIIFIGAAIAIFIIIADQYLKYKKYSFRLPVLAVAVGLYLPFELDSSIFMGGILAYFIQRISKKSMNEERANNAGLLLASGLITGEALMGILLSGLTVFLIQSDMGSGTFKLFTSPSSWVGLFVFFFVILYLYRTVINIAQKTD